MLVTLEDAGKYIMKLPKAEHEATEWQAAMEAVILVATLGDATMFGGQATVNRSSRALTVWGKGEKAAPGYSAHTRRGRHQIATDSWRKPAPGD
jgi:hypothetical protein